MKYFGDYLEYVLSISKIKETLVGNLRKNDISDYVKQY